MKILLIAPRGKYTGLGKKFKYPLLPAGLCAVAALTPQGHEVQLVDEVVEVVDFSASPDLVGITAMTPVAPRGFEIAAQFRQRNIPVILGGLHATVCPEECLEHVDSVLIGEAEGLWDKVISDAQKGELKKIYRMEQYPALAGLPIPRRDLLKLDRYFPLHMVETTRGCPHNCDFCIVTTFYGGSYRTRPVSEVEEEIKQIAEGFKLTGLKRFSFPYENGMIFFADSNIIANRQYALDLFKMLAKYQIPWQSYATITIANDPELLDWAQKSRCIGLAVGIESLDQKALEKMGKGFNKAADYEEALKKIRDRGIGILASFVFGGDDDDPSIFEKTYRFVERTKIEASLYATLTPLPATKLRERLLAEGRIFDFDWSNYDCTHLVFRPKKMTERELIDGVRWVWEETLSHGSIWRRIITTREFSFYLVMNYAMRLLDKKIQEEIAAIAAAAHMGMQGN